MILLYQLHQNVLIFQLIYSHDLLFCRKAKGLSRKRRELTLPGNMDAYFLNVVQKLESTWSNALRSLF